MILLKIVLTFLFVELSILVENSNVNVSLGVAKKFIEGEPSAIQTVYLSYRKLLFFIIVSIVKNESDANDVYQDVFTELLQKPNAIQDPKNLHSYLINSAKNAAINFVKKRDALIDYQSLLDFYANEEQDNPYLQEVTEGLPSLEAVVVIYHLNYGFSFVEIAKITNLSRQTVSSYYHKGIKDLRQIFKKGGAKNV